MRMPIGKYKGKSLDSIPKPYCLWFLREVNGFADVRAALLEMFVRRGDKIPKPENGKKKSPKRKSKGGKKKPRKVKSGTSEKPGRTEVGNVTYFGPSPEESRMRVVHGVHVPPWPGFEAEDSLECPFDELDELDREYASIVG